MTGAPLLTVSSVSKSFPGLKALDDLALDVHAGEVVSIVGQNGSGKSTLVKILAGVYSPDPGAVIGAGDGGEAPSLRFIHQDLGLVAMLSTVENLDLGDRPGRRGLLPVRSSYEATAARAAVARFGGDFDVRAPVGTLSAAERTIVAIARAMDSWEGGRRVLVLDEPTAALPRSEDELLFGAIRRVAKEGAGVIFISHHLDEVLDISDRVVALRDGRKVADLPIAEVDHARLISLIVGRQIEAVERRARRGDAPGESVLTVRRLRGRVLRDVDLDLHEGEILGVAGLLGSGRDELPAALFGAVPRRGGEVKIDGGPLPAGPRRAIEAGLAYVPADRATEGAVMPMSVRENLTLPDLGRLGRPLLPLDRGTEREEVRRWIEDVGLLPPRPEQPLELFSGGNQQKVVLAKWLRNKPKVLLLDDPTQGVDVGAKAAIYKLIGAVAAAGAAVMIASSDTEELAALCDRVIVLRDGSVGAVLTGEELDEERLLAQILGLASPTDQPPNQN